MNKSIFFKVFIIVFICKLPACSDLFFECIGSRVPLDHVKPFWRYDEIKELKKLTPGDLNSSLNHYPIVCIERSFSFKNLGTCVPRYLIDNSKREQRNISEYARTVLCPAKFGEGHYEVCSIPNQLCNKVYVKIDGKYELMIEPADPAGKMFLKRAYLDTIASSFYRLAPDSLTNILSEIHGRYCAQKGPQSIDNFLRKFGFEPQGKTWIPRSKSHLKKAVAFGINPHDWLKCRGEYKHFQDFFTRKLKEGVRTIAEPFNPNVIVAPADSKLTVIENVEKDITLFSVKQEDFTLSRFLGNDILAQEFDGGTMMIFRLSPYNYHHYHGAVDAIPSEGTFIKKIGLESVDPIAYKTKIDPLITNKRMLVKLDTPYGIIPMVVVGAYNVGSINNTYIPCQEYKKGAELGYFKLGGSTVVLLFKKGQIIPIKEFVEHSLQGFETAVFLGEKVATFTQSLTEEEIKVWKKSTTTLCEKP
ncbi:TPA: hypothetical protein DIC20_02660 [Candidatus Dependentiae bacterium]|nr:MAG: Phosphatidylserine decarboxylase proenzyme [candidate division TM6 bacterium GW2011_GWF2_36_131]KKQ02369.1 MAG: Phosphatidylserine decarboxylase proenzyme [candidate division TM6 bacterium GW2011_GWE2_36_25]KKQ18648.1 MAG: Phosphatidylserine decarboxylase proenzyme [candidate division TM6 bacterium GW2011_GWA2_36_9]HBR70974.1 hypothetical protein [Candidatus Dependentiae bacterium]HCU00581.1 hypothetical protein [Candidatus Dependentiae bacterium]